LPNSAFIARKAIAAKGLEHDVTVHEGDFLVDELPTGFDRILYSRVLCDWSPEVCMMQFQKARRALAPGGKLIINEGFLEGNLELSISWEYRYIFYDTFGRAMYKPLEVYRKLLSEAGFVVIKVFPITMVFSRICIERKDFATPLVVISI
jgi:acetylserotonin N-methyltransferase